MTSEEQQNKYQKFLETDFTVFDLETSGLDPTRDEILEVAAIKINGKDIIDKFESLVKPTRPIPSAAEKIHGLNEIYLLANGRDLKNVLSDFINFIGDSIAVGHNIRAFDWPFILNNTKKVTQPLPQNKIIDTLELSRKLLTLPRYTLSSVAANFNIDHPDAHRAMPDVKVNANVFMELMELLLNGTNE